MRWPIWEQKDGTQVPIDRMATSHIVKAMAMVRRMGSSQKRNGPLWIERFQIELIAREIEGR